MQRVALITVEDTFCLRSNNSQTAPILVIYPDFSVPLGRWKDRTETVAVLTPHGGDFETTAQFTLSHLNISDPDAPLDRRWRVTILLPNKTSEDVPKGSTILVSHELRDALLQTPVA